MISTAALMIALVTSQPGIGVSDGFSGPDYSTTSNLTILDYVDPSEYTIGTGDWLWISIAGGLPFLYDTEDLEASSVLNLPVTIDGNIVIPAIAAVPVAGLSLAEAKEAIVNAITFYYRGIDVSVGLSSPATFRIPVSGQVLDPGIVTINGITRLSQILDRAGGISPAGSWTRIEIHHVEGDTTIVDLTDFVMNGNLKSNPLLVRSDRIHVPMAEQFVEIEGAVYLTCNALEPRQSTTAGSGAVASSATTDEVEWSQRAILEYIPGETASELLMRAGGFTVLALRDQCYIERREYCGTVIIPAELDNFDVDPILMPDDRLVVPSSAASIAVVGEVTVPGSFPYVAGRGYEYYVAQAGGFTHESYRSGTRITLPDGQEYPADQVWELRPGSIIEVPRQAIVWWEDYLAILTGLATVFIAYKSVFE
jgi:protein involved in polysaccharide export with SLBB domain